MEKLRPFLNWISAGIFLLMTIGFIFFLILKDRPEIPVAPANMPVSRDSENEMNNQDKPGMKQDEIEPVIMIDVQGSVKNPGVYQMKAGDRVIHAIKKAGGFIEEAEIRSVNQAQKISDEMIIYVAAKGEEVKPQIPKTQSGNGNKININAADSAELQSLSGIGPSKAESIISFREENGPFTSIEQLLEIRGIGEKTIEDWKDKIEFQ